MMTTWFDTLPQQQLKQGEKHAIEVNGMDLLLIHLTDGIYAIDNRCTHADAELTDGEIDNDEIICPWHGARFCVKTGAVTCPPAFEDLETYPVRIEQGMIQVQI